MPKRALTEPWACVTAAYGLHYRDGLKAGGTAWIIRAGGQGSGIRDQEAGSRYTISSGFDATSHPARLILTNVPAPFAAWLRERAAALGVEVLDAPDVAALPVNEVDDIVLLVGRSRPDRGGQPASGEGWRLRHRRRPADVSAGQP